MIVALGWLCLAIRLGPYYIRVVYSLQVNTPAPPPPSFFIPLPLVYTTNQTFPHPFYLFSFLSFPFFLLFPKTPPLLIPFILSPPPSFLSYFQEWCTLWGPAGLAGIPTSQIVCVLFILIDGRFTLLLVCVCLCWPFNCPTNPMSISF